MLALTISGYREGREGIMGLDQYMKVERDGLLSEHSQGVGDSEEVFYWRKHPNLHGFFEQCWLALPENAGKTGVDFNCVDLYMTEEILDKLEAWLHPTRATGSLPETDGFFVGKSDGYYDDQDRKMLEFCRGALQGGKRVFYTSWW